MATTTTKPAPAPVTAAVVTDTPSTPAVVAVSDSFKVPTAPTQGEMVPAQWNIKRIEDAVNEELEELYEFIHNVTNRVWQGTLLEFNKFINPNRFK